MDKVHPRVRETIGVYAVAEPRTLNVMLHSCDLPRCLLVGRCEHNAQNDIFGGDPRPHMVSGNGSLHAYIDGKYRHVASTRVVIRCVTMLARMEGLPSLSREDS